MPNPTLGTIATPDPAAFHVSVDQQVTIHGTNFDNSKPGGNFAISVHFLKIQNTNPQSCNSPTIVSVSADGSTIVATIPANKFSTTTINPEILKGTDPGLTITVTNSDHTTATNAYAMTFAP